MPTGGCRGVDTTSAVKVESATTFDARTLSNGGFTARMRKARLKAPLKRREENMTSDLCTLGALALVLVFGWLLDHVEQWRARGR
jgi:hypothetical protein